MTILDRPVTWTPTCTVHDLVPGRGVCALVGSYQVAIFRVEGDGEMFALSNYDPFSGAYVLSRGIVGSKGGVAKVTSPIYKQGFDLRTGQCLDDPEISVATFPTRVVDGRIEIGVP